MSLPTELLTEIILFALPSVSQFSSETYQDRQTFLSNCCLVSRHLEQVAEPLLYSIVWARNSRQFNALIESVSLKGNEHDIRWLVLAFNEGVVSRSQVMLAGKTLPSVTHLSLRDMSLPNLIVLNSFTKVKSLTLERVRQRSNECFSLPSLEHLTVGYGSELPLSRVTDKAAPNLSAVAIRRPTELEGWYPSLSSTTPWNLPVFVLNWNYYYHWRQPLPNVLVDYSFKGIYILESGVQHLRFVLPSVESLGNLNQILAFLQKKRSPLETLILPASLDPSLSLSSVPPFLSNAEQRLVDEIVKVCFEKGTELIFEAPSDHSLDSDISPAFVAKMKRRLLATIQNEESSLQENDEDDEEEEEEEE